MRSYLAILLLCLFALGEGNLYSQSETTFEKPNRIELSVFNALLSHSTISYERIFANGYLGARVPVSLLLGTVDDGRGVARNKKRSVGLDLRWYVAGAEKTSFVVAPCFEVGEYGYVMPTTTALKTSEATQLSISYTEYLITMGFVEHPSPQISMYIAVGAGAGRSDISDFYNYNFGPTNGNYIAWRVDLNIGYRFGR